MGELTFAAQGDLASIPPESAIMKLELHVTLDPGFYIRMLQGDLAKNSHSCIIQGGKEKQMCVHPGDSDEPIKEGGAAGWDSHISGIRNGVRGEELPGERDGRLFQQDPRSSPPAAWGARSLEGGKGDWDIPTPG